MIIRHVPFLDVFADASGGNVKTPQAEYQKSGQFPVIDQGKSLVAGYVDDESRLCGSGQSAIVFGDHTRCVKYIDFPFCMGADGVKILRPKIEADLKYLYYYLRQLNLPDAGYSRHFKYLKRAEVVLLPLPEQRRIAAILDQADALRARRREALAQLDSLTQSIFIDMFGDPGSNAKKWPVVALSELIVGKPNNGIFKKNDEYGAGLPVVWVEELFRGNGINCSHSRRLEPSKRELEQYGLYHGDVLFCRSSLKLAGIGYNNVYLGERNKTLFECHVIRISPDKNKLDPMFLNFALRMPNQRQKLFKHAKTVTMSTIDQDGLLRLDLPVPPLYLQKQFAEQLDAIEGLKAKHANALAELDALFASLQHRAFRGEL